MKVGVALEYITQQALHAGRISGTISPKSRKRHHASPSQSPTLAAAATTADVRMSGILKFIYLCCRKKQVML